MIWAPQTIPHGCAAGNPRFFRGREYASTTPMTYALLVIGWLLLGSANSSAFSATLQKSLAPRASNVKADPSEAARQVFQGDSFWWKRIKPPKPQGETDSRVARFIYRIVRKVISWIIDLMRRLRDSITSPFTSRPSALKLIAWVVVVGLLAFAMWKLIPWILSWFSRKNQHSEDPNGTLQWQTLAESSVLYQQALEALRNGKEAEAVRLALLALIAFLEKRGRLRYDHARTNREYLVELRPHVELATNFRKVSRIFDRVWYGNEIPQRSEAEHAVEVCGIVINKQDVADG